MGELTLFRAIWLMSWILAGTSVLIIFVLFIRRLFIHANQRRIEARRAVLEDLVFRHLDGPPDVFPTLPKARDQRLLLSIGTDMLRSVTGEMRASLIALLKVAIDVDALLKQMRRAPPADRAKIASRLYWCDMPAVHAALREALGDKNPDVILAAVNSLLAADQPLDLISLVAKLEARQMLGHRAVRDIFRKVAPSNGTALFALLDDPNPAIAVLAIDAIARIPNPAILRRLRAAAQTHPSVDVRATALRTLGLVRDQAAQDVIMAALSDPAWEVRTQAAVAAGRAMLTAAVPRLITLLQDRNWWVQLRSAQALAQLGQDGQAALRTLADDAALEPLVKFVLAERAA
jgi:HEAT repeat protein